MSSAKVISLQEPHFEERPTIDGIPAATIQDLLELKTAWIEQLNQSVVEMFYSQGATTVTAPGTTPTTGTGLSGKIAGYLNQVVLPHSLPMSFGIVDCIPTGQPDEGLNRFKYNNGDIVDMSHIRQASINVKQRTFRFLSWKLANGDCYCGEIVVSYSLSSNRFLDHTWSLGYYKMLHAPDVTDTNGVAYLRDLTKWACFEGNLPSGHAAVQTETGGSSTVAVHGPGSVGGEWVCTQEQWISQIQTGISPTQALNPLTLGNRVRPIYTATLDDGVLFHAIAVRL